MNSWIIYGLGILTGMLLILAWNLINLANQVINEGFLSNEEMNERVMYGGGRQNER